MKVLILANSTIGLYRFRKELIKQLVTQYQVVVSVPEGDYISELSGLGCKLILNKLNRHGKNPLQEISLYTKYKRLMKQEKPDVVLTYTIKPNIYGGIAARKKKIPYISTVTGLGTALESDRIVTRIIGRLYRYALKHASCIMFQNERNRSFFTPKGLNLQKTRLIAGSGVNLNEYTFYEYPPEDKNIDFLFVGRIMKDKGIDELLYAAKKIKEKYDNITFMILGDYDEDYQTIIEENQTKGYIKYMGYQTDVVKYIRLSHAVILPSYHEGMANVLLEAAASGRPVLASRISGCMETFDEGISGIGFEPRSGQALTDAIEQFINLPYHKLVEMGKKARNKMEQQFDRNLIVATYLSEIQNIINTRGKEDVE